MPSRGLYNPCHPLQEPEKSIDEMIAGSGLAIDHRGQITRNERPVSCWSVGPGAIFVEETGPDVRYFCNEMHVDLNKKGGTPNGSHFMTPRFSQTIYTTLKVDLDGATPMYWFIIAPYKSLYFLGVASHWSCQYGVKCFQIENQLWDTTP